MVILCMTWTIFPVDYMYNKSYMSYCSPISDKRKQFTM